jgi:hypothetical protein
MYITACRLPELKLESNGIIKHLINPPPMEYGIIYFDKYKDNKYYIIFDKKIFHEIKYNEGNTRKMFQDRLNKYYEFGLLKKRAKVEEIKNVLFDICRAAANVELKVKIENEYIFSELKENGFLDTDGIYTDKNVITRTH